MEVSSVLVRKGATNPAFKHHWRCGKLKVTHLTFADDVMLFTKADVGSTKIIMQVLHTFAQWFGLQHNPTKGTIFISATSLNIKDQLLALTGFMYVTLPMQYLGVPLVSPRLAMQDCQRLVGLISHWITHWTAKFLSQAGTIQLVNSILFSIQAYWSSLFVLPSGVFKRLEQLKAKFLWGAVNMKEEKAWVTWKDVTRLRCERGLDIKKLSDWNRATALKHIWIDWVQQNLIRDQNFWHAHPPARCLWIWRSLLSLQHLMKPLMSWRMRDGSRISFWMDEWLPNGDLITRLGADFIFSVNSRVEVSVAEFYMTNKWQAHIQNYMDRTSSKFRPLLQCLASLIPTRPPFIQLQPDTIIWKPQPIGKFTTKSARESIRARSLKVQ